MVGPGLLVLVGEIVGKGKVVFVETGMVAEGIIDLVIDGVGAEAVMEDRELPITVQLTAKRISPPKPQARKRNANHFMRVPLFYKRPMEYGEVIYGINIVNL